MPNRHRFLKRQLKKLGLGPGEVPSYENWQKFIDTVDNYIKETDQDRYLLERALAISSEEMNVASEKQRVMNIELAQSSKLASLGTLAAGIAHELNNPLAGVIGYAEVLQETPDLGQKNLERVSRILSLGERMAKTVKHLLKLSRRPKDVNPTNLLLKEVISEALQLGQEQFKYDNIEVEVHLGEEEIYVQGDMNRLVSVFQNLLNNSYDEFTKKGSTSIEGAKLEILYSEKRSNSETISIEVRDNAGGISKENLGRIFDPFYTTKDVNSGTGLGLTLSKNLMNELGGDLTVESQGCYTTFVVSLLSGELRPTLKEALIKDYAFSSFQRLPEDRKKVLIVDDEEDLLDLLKLRLNGIFDVTSTVSPKKAVDFLKERKFDLLISDLKMPEISGDKLVGIAREISPNIACCIVSGHINAVSSLESNRHFANVVLVEKPIPKQNEFMNLLWKALDMVKVSSVE